MIPSLSDCCVFNMDAEACHSRLHKILNWTTLRAREPILQFEGFGVHMDHRQILLSDYVFGLLMRTPTLKSLQVRAFFHRLANTFKPRSANVKHGAYFDLGETDSNERHDDAIALSMLAFVALQAAPQLCDSIELILTASLLDTL